MEEIYGKLQLTARSYHKLLRVARTLADMDGGDRICDRHLEEAICYRSFDRKFWERGRDELCVLVCKYSRTLQLCENQYP